MTRRPWKSAPWRSAPWRSAIVLWIAAPVLLALGLVRPPVGSQSRSLQLPASVAGHELVRENRLTEREYDLLGTRDVVWRTYRGDDGRKVFSIAVFHEANWKSVHPPHICLRGSDMVLRADRRHRTAIDGRDLEVGEIVAFSNSARREYLSWFVYGAPEFSTPSYAGFVWRHLPRAVLRQSDPGFLLRVETWIDGDDGLERARERCRRFLRVVLPAAEAALR